jgi:hypothetical protein
MLIIFILFISFRDRYLWVISSHCQWSSQDAVFWYVACPFIRGLFLSSRHVVACWIMVESVEVPHELINKNWFPSSNNVATIQWPCKCQLIYFKIRLLPLAFPYLLPILSRVTNVSWAPGPWASSNWLGSNSEFVFWNTNLGIRFRFSVNTA